MKKLIVVAVGCALASGAFASKGFQASLTPDVAVHDRDTEINGVSIGVWNENPSPKFQWQLGGRGAQALQGGQQSRRSRRRGARGRRCVGHRCDGRRPAGRRRRAGARWQAVTMGAACPSTGPADHTRRTGS